MHPLLASSFDGIEVLLIAPVLGVFVLAGLICVATRKKAGVLVCGVVCCLIGGFSFWAGAIQSEKAQQGDYPCAMIAFVFGIAFCLYSWRAKRRVRTRPSAMRA